MSADTVCTCGNAVVAEDKNSSNSKVSGIRLFKSIVRRVRQKITERKLLRSSSIEDVPTLVAKLDRMSMEDASNANGQTSPSTALFGSDVRSGYSSDSGTERRRDTRVRIRQKLRSRSKSDTRKGKKKPKKILRPPPTYVYVRGLSGIPTQRIRVR